MERLLTDLLVADRARELRARAGRNHLARLAACCRPSAWARWVGAGLQALSRIAPGHRASVTACCA